MGAGAVEGEVAARRAISSFLTNKNWCVVLQSRNCRNCSLHVILVFGFDGGDKQRVFPLWLVVHTYLTLYHAMSVSTPTLIPRPQLFPRLLPTPPHPPQTYPLPKSHSFPANSASLWTSGGQSNAGGDLTSSSGRSSVGIHGHLNAKRNLQREMDDLSEEENELDELVSFSFEFALLLGSELYFCCAL